VTPHNLIALMEARRLAKDQTELWQDETSKKLVKMPVHVYQKLMEATRQVLLEELDD